MVSGGDTDPTTSDSGPSISPARSEVLRHLPGAPDSRSIADLGRLTDRHANTLREHLDALVQLGLARRVRQRPDGPGRPAWRYARVRPADLVASYDAQTADLVALLRRQSRNPVREAERAGERWGTMLARERPLAPGCGAAEALAGLLQEIGFEAAEVGQDLTLTRPDTEPLVWRVHLGLARGAWWTWAKTGGPPLLHVPRTGEGGRLVVRG